jgi:hypothetical protein
LLDKVSDIHDTGSELIILGNGSAEQARHFVSASAVDVPVYTDPSLRVYRALGTRRGLLSSLHPGVLLSTARALRSGFRQTGTMGTATQQGGVFVILPGGEMPYRYVSRFAGDHPDPGEVIAALREAIRRDGSTGG